MNRKQSCGYILFTVLISCITLMPSNYTNSYKRIEEKLKRFKIKSPEWAYIPDSNLFTISGGTTVTIPSTKNKALVEPLPLPDPNTPIIINLLSKKSL